MNRTKYTPTPEPWNRDTHKVYEGPDSDREVPIEDYERAFPCVNACAGMADPAADITRLRAELAEAREAVRVLANNLAEYTMHEGVAGQRINCANNEVIANPAARAALEKAATP